MVGKPFRANRDRDEIAKADAGTEHQAPSEIKHGQGLCPAGKQQPETKQAAADRGHAPRSNAPLHEPRHQKHGGDHDGANGRHERRLRSAPSEFTLQRGYEDAPRVICAERDVQKTAPH